MNLASHPIDLTQSNDSDLLMRLLFDALPNRVALQAAVEDARATAYTATVGKKLVGAVVVRWDEPSEIELLAVPDNLRERGHGKAIVLTVLSEARRRRVQSVVVGTSSIAVGNMIFYQKCGFRMSGVRRDHFTGLRPQLVVRGILLRDMIVFDNQLDTVE